MRRSELGINYLATNYMKTWLLLQWIRLAHAANQPAGGGVTGGSGGTTGGLGGTTGGSGSGFNLQNPLGQGATPYTVLERITDYLIYISVIILPAIVIYGAFQILTAADNPEKFESGKKTILYAVIGFAIIISARGLVFVVGEILGVQIPFQP